MKTLFTAALMMAAASFGAIAAAQAYEEKKPDIAAAQTPAPNVIIVPPLAGAVLPGGPTAIPDGRAMASDAEVGSARRYYRAQCDAVESTGFCTCVSAGVAQALAPSEVRIAARTIRQRIGAQGDAISQAEMSDATPQAQNSVQRIEQIEGHYADACAQFRG